MQSAGVARVSGCSTADSQINSMDQKGIEKEHWARVRATSLWQQTDELDSIRSGDSRAGRHAGAALTGSARRPRGSTASPTGCSPSTTIRRHDRLTQSWPWARASR